MSPLVSLKRYRLKCYWRLSRVQRWKISDLSSIISSVTIVYCILGAEMSTQQSDNPCHCKRLKATTKNNNCYEVFTMNDNPSTQEWKKLYQAALEFKQAECWDWVWDSDLFGIQNPKTGEIGYCCVMGMLKEYYALAVFLGTEGLDGYFRIQSGEVSSFDFLYVQKCLMASFEDRKLLHKQDRDIIKELGLKFRGRNAWPLFRNYEPGYVPWFLTRDDAQFLTLALHQAIEVCLRLREDQEMLEGPTEDHYLVRVFQEEKWVDQWMTPPPLEKAEPVAICVDKNRLEKIKRMITQHQRTWETDVFYSREGVREKDERPYYPYIMLWIDHHSGFILNIHLAGPAEYAPEFMEQFLGILEKIKFAPKEILVKKEELLTLLEPITSQLGINVKKVRELPVLEEAQEDMFESLMG